MIEINREQSYSTQSLSSIKRKIVGVGGAGSTIIDRLIIDGLEAHHLIAINTDAQALASSVAQKKIPLGYALTHGLGAGGDPEVGMSAAQDALPELREAMADNELIFVVAGLGGGTGSGSAPFVAHAAREEGALVIGIVTMPFTFEGRRRNEQAVAALDHLRQICHAVICFENDRMSELVAPKTGIQQAFIAADQTISECMRGIMTMLASMGVMKVGLADLLTVLRTDNSSCLFGFGSGEGENRAHEALAQALRNPLMNRGKLLEESANVLVHIAGSKNLTLAEIEIVMNELNRHTSDATQLLLGTSIEARLGAKLTITILGSLGHKLSVAKALPAIPKTDSLENSFAQTKATEDNSTKESLDLEESPATVTTAENAIPAIKAVPSKAPTPIKPSQPVPEKPTLVKQEILQFEPVSRGRFEKSEPTIIEGLDLDVPTVLRKGYRV